MLKSGHSLLLEKDYRIPSSMARRSILLKLHLLDMVLVSKRHEVISKRVAVRFRVLAPVTNAESPKTRDKKQPHTVTESPSLCR